MLAVIYPAASLLATYLMSVGRAHHYDSHLLVYSGKPLSNKQTSKIMALTTLEYLGIGLGLRDVRQLMCTILVNISRCNFGVPDEEDRELMEIHRLSNHSAKTAESRYARSSNRRCSLGCFSDGRCVHAAGQYAMACYNWRFTPRTL